MRALLRAPLSHLKAVRSVALSLQLEARVQFVLFLVEVALRVVTAWHIWRARARAARDRAQGGHCVCESIVSIRWARPMKLRARVGHIARARRALKVKIAIPAPRAGWKPPSVAVRLPEAARVDVARVAFVAGRALKVAMRVARRVVARSSAVQLALFVGARCRICGRCIALRVVHTRIDGGPRRPWGPLRCWRGRRRWRRRQWRWRGRR